MLVLVNGSLDHFYDHIRVGYFFIIEVFIPYRQLFTRTYVVFKMLALVLTTLPLVAIAIGAAWTACRCKHGVSIYWRLPKLLSPV